MLYRTRSKIFGLSSIHTYMSSVSRFTRAYTVHFLFSSPPSRRVVGKPSRLNWSENARKRVKVSPVLQYLTVGALSPGRSPPPVITSCDLCSVKTTHLQTIRQFGRSLSTWLLNAVHVVLSMRQRRWVRRPLMCWRPPTAAARWRRSSIHRRARSNAPEMIFLCARAAVQRVAAADALCERHPTMTMECMYFAPHTRPARPHAHTHFAEASSESECALLRLMGPSGPSYPLRCRLWRRKPAGNL